MSTLDSNCLVVGLKVDSKAKDVDYRLECFQGEAYKNDKEQKDMVEEVYIKMKD